MALYTRTAAGIVAIAQLQTEINASPDIIPSCMGVSENDGNLTFEFADVLSVGEEAILTALVAAHVPAAQEIDVSLLPLSDLDGIKLAVHTSYKPEIAGHTTYAVWAGCGDDVVSNPTVLGGGDLLDFEMVVDTPVVTKDIKFDHSRFGRIWIHEAYLKFENGGHGDYVTSDIIASASALQTAASLDLVLDGTDVKYAPGGAGTGTHGFAATPTLLPRTFSMDGDWDYDGTNLTPNMTGTGGYKISTIENSVHRYVNKIPCCGSSPYFSMSSDETSEILPGYFIRAYCHNISNTAWSAAVIMEIYREQTVDP